jgi:hypothetical protein
VSGNPAATLAKRWVSGNQRWVSGNLQTVGVWQPCGSFLASYSEESKAQCLFNRVLSTRPFNPEGR